MTDCSEKAPSGARLVAVVVTYNRLTHLRTCLAALRGQACDAIVVVDNHSTDGTGDWLAEQQGADPRLDVLTMTRNLGGAGGFEAGFRHARARYRPEWLVCFDDDAWPRPGAFRAFLDSDLDGIDAAAAAVYFPDDTVCEMNRPGLNPFWHPRRFLKTVLGQGRRGFHLDDADYRAGAPVDIDSTSFVGFFVRGAMVDRVGLPEGRLFIYGDDVLYALNVRRQGGRIAFLPWVRFTHDCATFSTHEKTFEPLWKAYYTYRNGLRVYHTAAGVLFWPFLPLKLARWLLNARHYDDARPYLRLTWAALRDAAAGRYDRPHEAVLKMARGER